MRWRKKIDEATKEPEQQGQILEALRTVNAQFGELKQAIAKQEAYMQHLHQAIQVYDNKFSVNHDQMIVEMLGSNQEPPANLTKDSKKAPRLQGKKTNGSNTPKR